MVVEFHDKAYAGFNLVQRRIDCRTDKRLGCSVGLFTQRAYLSRERGAVLAQIMSRTTTSSKIPIVNIRDGSMQYAGDRIGTKHKLNIRHCVKIGQWNVRGLNSLGKLSILGNELDRLNVTMCGLSETKWSGSGHFTTFDGHTVLFSGGTEREHHGVAIWVHKRVASSLTFYNPVSSRVISATFTAKPRDVTLIQCYAPTADKSDEEIKLFYTEVGRVLAETPKHNIVLITGDFNARVGEDAKESDVLGKYGHGERNDRGQMLIDFCADHKLVITNTLSRLHNRHR